MFHGSEPIGYRSTNGSSEVVDFGTAVLKGMASDKGLYMPTHIPRLSAGAMKSMKRMSLPDIAVVVTEPYVNIPRNKLEEIMHDAYNFEVPLEHVNGRYVMRMDRGPTLSFKDFAMRPFARMVRYFLEKEYGTDKVDYVVLFPEKEVTDRQRKLMTTLRSRKNGGNNIFPLAVDGKFDDCQAMEKQAFVDPDLKRLGLSSANSINIGRLIPQTVQYFYAYSRLDGSAAVFAVPCGNFGHVTAGLMAQRMGLPAYKYITAVNENDEFPKLLEKGDYHPIRPSRNCISNSMNVGHPSNLARVVAMYGGRMNEKGEILRMPDMDAMRGDVFSASVSDKETRETTRNVFQRYGVVLEPHGAVAWRGLERFLAQDMYGGPRVVFETAHPWKFPEEVKSATGVEPETPESMRGLDDAKEWYLRTRGYNQLKELLLQLDSPMIILTATSGDTGSAGADAFSNSA